MEKNQLFVIGAIAVLAAFAGAFLSSKLIGGPSGSLSELRIVDSSGKLRIFMGMEQQTAVVKMYGANTERNLLLSTDNTGAAVVLYKSSSNPQVGLTVSQDGSGATRFDMPATFLWVSNNN